MAWNERTPIISLWMPWAQWVMLGWKTIETREHSRFASLTLRRIGIHASLRWDDTALDRARPYLTPEQIAATDKFPNAGGVILGTVKVDSSMYLDGTDSPKALIDCGSVLRHGLFLSDPQIIEAIPAKGRQGVWYYRAGATPLHGESDISGDRAAVAQEKEQ